MAKLSNEFLDSVSQAAQQAAQERQTTTANKVEKPSAIQETGGRVLGGALKVIDFIERPYYGLMNAGHSIIDDDPKTNPLQAFYKGAITREETRDFSDITTELGWKPETTTGKIFKGGVDFVGGVLLDPATYLTAGYGKGAMVLGRGMKPLSKAGVAIFEKEAAKQLGRKFTGNALKKELKRMSPELYQNTIRNTLKAIEKSGTPEKFFGQTAVRFAGKTIPGSTKAAPAVARALKPILNTTVGRKGSIVGERAGKTLGDLFVPGYNVRNSKNLTLTQKFDVLNRADSYKLAREAAKGNRIQEAVNKFTEFSRKEREQVTFEIEKFLPTPVMNKAGTKAIDFQASTAKIEDITDPKIRQAVADLKEQLTEVWKAEVKAGLRDPDKIIEEGYIKRITRGFVDKRPVTTGSLLPRKESVPTVQASKEAFKKADQSWYFEADSAKWLSARMTESDHLVMKKEVIDWLDNNNFIKKVGSAPMFDEAGKKVTGFKRDSKKILDLKAKGFEVIEYRGKEYMMLPEVAKEFNLVAKDFSHQGFQKFLTDFYDEALNIWKLSVTSLFPSFHARNAVSNSYLAFLGGAKNPARIKDAVAVQMYGRALRNGKKAKDKVLNIDGVDWKLSELHQLAAEHGILGSGWLGADFLKTAFIKPKISKGEFSLVQHFNWAAGKARKTGTAVENNARLTLFIDQLAKGKNAQEATIHTKKFLFDYGELTDFEKTKLKRVIPFYTWLRKNIPLQLEQVAKQPGKYAGVVHAKDAIEQFSGDEEEKFLPDFMRTQEMYIRMPNGKYFRPDLPFQDLSRAFELRNWVSASSPLIKGFFEVTANRNFFTGKPIADEKLPESKFKRQLWKNWVLDQMRTTSYWRKASNEDRTATQFYLDFLFGINTYPFDVAQGKRNYRLNKLQERQSELKFKKTQEKDKGKTKETIQRLFGVE